MLVLDVVSTSFGAIIGVLLGFMFKEEIMQKSIDAAMYLEQKLNQIKGDLKL